MAFEGFPSERPSSTVWQPGAFLWIFALLLAGIGTVFVPFVALMIVPVLIIGFTLGIWSAPKADEG